MSDYLLIILKLSESLGIVVELSCNLLYMLNCHAIVQWKFNVQKNGVYTGNCEKAWMCTEQVSESIFILIALSKSSRI